MSWFGRVGVALAVLAAWTPVASAQAGGDATRDAYFGAVAEFFELPASEANILGEWRLPVDEVPVVLFVARRAGISPEALVALRGAGRGWADLAGRYRVDPSFFYVPLPDEADAGPLAPVYQRYRTIPRGRWAEVTLGDADIVGLVNLRILAQTLRRAPQDVLAQFAEDTWADRYVRLISASRPRTP